jgi:hypothetical protein
MRTTLRYLTPLVAAVGAAAGILAAPSAGAAPNPVLPTCTNTGGNTFNGAGSTECVTPGNVQLSATPPIDDQPDYPYPYDDLFYGPALVFGDGLGPGGGGGGHR